MEWRGRMSDMSIGDAGGLANCVHEVVAAAPFAPWTLEQECLLCELVSFDSFDWSLVSLRLERPPVECQTHYFTVLHRVHVNITVLGDLLANRLPERWTIGEDRVLIQLANFNLVSFPQIALKLDRSAQECRERCELLLQPAFGTAIDPPEVQIFSPVSSTKSRDTDRRQAMSPPTPKEVNAKETGPRPWSQADIELVMRMKKYEGKSFAEIAPVVGRTPLSCQSTFYRYTDLY